MAIGYRLVLSLLIGLQALTGWLAGRNWHALPQLREESCDAADGATLTRPAPSVSIVIPARNEARRLPDLLHSLAALACPEVEVVVVDDASTDATARIAREAGARVISVPGPPPGWTGKSYACQVGANETAGDWLLFTDADTVHAPESLALSLRLAAHSAAGLVSLLPRHRCCTFWERLLLPYAHALYFVGARRVNRAGGSPVANGQYMLFHRPAYERIGGHAAVRASLIDDVALARLAAGTGISVVLARAEEYLAVRMYEGLPSLWEGFSKNSFRFVAISPRSGLLTVLASMTMSLALPAALRAPTRLLRTALLLVPALGLIPWVRRFGAPTAIAFLYPLAATIFQLIALDSVRRAFIPRGTAWKGRRY